MIQRTGVAARLTFAVHPHMLKHSTGYKLANDGHDTRSLAHYLGTQFAEHCAIYCASAGEVREILEGLKFAKDLGQLGDVGNGGSQSALGPSRPARRCEK